MPVSLTSVVDGTPIDYDALRAYTKSIEHYLNEGVVSADLQSTTPWVRSTQVFKPDFVTGIYSHARLTSGEVHWSKCGHSSFENSVHHSEVNTRQDGGGTAGKYVVVDGMTRTFSVPAAISTSATATVNTHRVAVAMDWYCYEMGGAGTVDDSTDHCSGFALFVNGTEKGATERPLYTGSPGAGGGISALGAVKQYSIRYPASITAPGKHEIGLRIRMYSHTAQKWRHIIVSGRTATWSWYVR